LDEIGKISEEEQNKYENSNWHKFYITCFRHRCWESALNLIKEFDKHEIYYTELSLPEAVWLIRRLLKEGNIVDFKIVITGLKSVFKTYHLLNLFQHTLMQWMTWGITTW
jgi:hypothetical protein